MTDLPALLSLGRLDGRLQNSPAADIWLARARIDGAAALAASAGLPVRTEAIDAWICGRTPPPRHLEGLDDPLSVAAIFHFALLAGEGSRDQLGTATLRVLRTLLDDRAAAEQWAQDDLVRFGPAFRRIQRYLSAPYPAATVQAVAERMLEAARDIDDIGGGSTEVTTIDGRKLRLDPRGAGTTWLLAAHLPRALAIAGLTLRPLPSLVALPRHLPKDAPTLARQIEEDLGRIARSGLRELDRLEARLARLLAELHVTRRSKAPLLLRLELAYPGLRVPAIARLLGISPQGAAKLARRAGVESASPPPD